MSPSQIGQREAISQQATVNHITTVLGSPSIPSRKLGLELVVALCYVDDNSLQLVLTALDSLSNNNNERGPFTFWFKATLMTMLSRGKMGSLVGTSKDFKKAVGSDLSLGDYTVRIPRMHYCTRANKPPIVKHVDAHQWSTRSSE